MIAGVGGPKKAVCTRVWSTNCQGLSMANSSSIVPEIWAYMRVRRKWWLLPIIVVMVLVGALLVFAQGSVLAPFIYAIF